MNVTLHRRTLNTALVAVFGIAFVLNFIWEMLQMPLFQGLDWSPASWALCAAASLGDAAFSTAAYAALALWHRDAGWVCQRDARDVGWVVTGGLLVAVLGERLSQAWGWWSYSSLMPLVPLIGVGVVPLVQLAVLTVATFETVRSAGLCGSRPHT